ncbi:unnamed protein product, partial [Laminaria digitata]
MQVEVRPLQIDYPHPMSPGMVFRGEQTEGFYNGMVDVVSTRRSVYGQSGRSSSDAISGASSRLASVGGEAMASTRRLFRQTSSDIAATLTKRGAKADRLAAVGDGGDSFGRRDPGPPEGAFQDQGYGTTRPQEAGGRDDSSYHTEAAFTNQAGSTPGKHGVPFGRRGPAAGPPTPQRPFWGSSQGAGASGGAGPVTPPGLPGADA